MYNVGELIPEIDRLSDVFSEDIQQMTGNMYFRSGFTQFGDSTYKKIKNKAEFTSVLALYDIRQQVRIAATALDNVRSTKQALGSKKKNHQQLIKTINKHEIAFHEKFALAISCIILFFVGAPLGAIIRKGGMGLPMVIAVVLFLTYHFIGIFAKNSAEDGTMHPFMATWISSFIMLPLSIWLTYRATTDRGIFDFDAFFQRFKWRKKK